jgi:hypothetical protein
MLQPDTQRIVRFVADEVTSEMVKQILLESFMKKREGDVATKAAQMMAIDLLQDGWKELQQYKNNRKSDVKNIKQVAL